MRNIVKLFLLVAAMAVASTAFAQSAPPAAGDNITVGLLMVGPYNDHGWSQANYDAMQYVVNKVPGVQMIYLDKANPADRPGTTVSQLAESLVAKGAKLIIFSSDDMSDEAVKFAQAHTDIFVIMSSGSQVWKDGKDLPGPAQHGEHHGPHGVHQDDRRRRRRHDHADRPDRLPGPLINDETRRLASSVYLGARYAWTNYLNKDPAKLKFKVTWIGFWFNIPGVTSDPSQVADDFFNSGYDVVVSGIDTTEATTEAVKCRHRARRSGRFPTTTQDAIAEGPSVDSWRSLLQLGPCVRQRHQVGDGRDLEVPLRVEWP